MKALALLSRKGGAGKTTLAIHLAVEAARSGAKVAIIDADPQRSALGWWQGRDRDAPDLVEAEPGMLAQIVAGCRSAGFDLVVIDTRPSADADAIEAAGLSDLSLIAVRPSVLDLRAAAGTVEAISAAKGRGRFVINAAPPGRGYGEAAIVRETRSALSGYGLPVCQSIVTARSAYSSALIGSLAVCEHDATGKAALEISNLWNEIRGTL
jgi:chromosome partitioning protein